LFIAWPRKVHPYMHIVNYGRQSWFSMLQAPKKLTPS
jgi:hypothetical protein